MPIFACHISAIMYKYTKSIWIFIEQTGYVLDVFKLDINDL